MAKYVLNNNGMSIIEVVVSATIMSTMALGMAMSMSHMSKQQSHINRKMEALEFNQSISNLLGDQGFCGCNFNGLTFTATDVGNSSFSINSANNQLVADCNGTPKTIVQANEELPGSNTHLRVDSIKLRNITSLSGGSIYSAEVVVGWKVPGNSTQIKPSVSNVMLETTGDTTRTISGCGLELSEAAEIVSILENRGCTADQLLGFDSNGNLTCVDAPVTASNSGSGGSGIMCSGGATEGTIRNDYCSDTGSLQYVCTAGQWVFFNDFGCQEQSGE